MWHFLCKDVTYWQLVHANTPYPGKSPYIVEYSALLPEGLLLTSQYNTMQVAGYMLEPMNKQVELVQEALAASTMDLPYRSRWTI